MHARIRLFGFAAVSVLILATSVARAQAAPTPNSQVITLQAAVEAAQKNNPMAKGAEEAANQARFEKYALRSALLPQIDLTATAAERKDSIADRPTGALAFGGGSYNLYTVGIHAEQPIAAYGLFSATKQARIQEDLAKKSLEITRRDLTSNVVSAYYETVYNENLVRILQEQEKSLREIVGISRRRMGLGGKRVDYLQSQTQLALLLPRISSAQNSLISSTAKLARLMGLEGADNIVISTHIPELALKDVSPSLNLQQIDVPELQRARLERERVQQEKAIALGRHLPQLKLTGDYSYANFTKAELFDGPSNAWQGALVLNIPIFSGLSSISQRRALNAREVQLESTERNIRNQLSVAQIDSRKMLESAESTLSASLEGERLAKETLAEARRDYNVGLINFVEYNTIQQSYFQASTSLLQNRYNALNAYSVYFASSGQSLSTLVELMSKQGPKQ